MKLEVNARGLKPDEIQRAIDTAVEQKKNENRPIIEVLRDLEEHYLRLTQLVPDVAARMAQVIKKHHPQVFQEVAEKYENAN